MRLDNEEQRKVILDALLNQRIQGDYVGIMDILPSYTAVVEAVKTATLEKPGEQSPDTYREISNVEK